MKRAQTGWMIGVVIGLVAVTALAWSAAAQAADGKQVFMDAKCNMCHAVPSAEIEATVKSEKMKGPDLTEGDPDPAWLAQYIKQEVEKDGAKHKKGFQGTDEELKALVDWLLEQKAG